MNNAGLCDESGILSVVMLVKSFLEIIKIAVPIVLILFCLIDTIKNIVSPNEVVILPKNVGNRFLASMVVFFVASIVNTFFTMLDVSNITVHKCWTNANTTYINQLKTEETKKINEEIEKNKKPLSNEEKRSKAIEIRTNIDWEQISSSSGGTGVPADPGALADGKCTQLVGPVANPSAKAVVEEGKKYLGNPYVYGGTSLTNGIDCSGYTQALYKNVFNISLPRTSVEQRTFGQLVGVGAADLSKAKAGDLILYDGHVAIFMGEGNKIIHASNKKDGIKISDNAAYKPVLAIRRIICS
jgi:Cell wall-associated hydrolases (invasion-associated proteins)